MKAETLKNVQISVAKGNATYEMEKGSFEHKEELTEKRGLEMTGLHDTETGFEAELADPLTGKKGKYRVTQKGDQLEVHFDLAELGINRLWFSFDACQTEHIYGSGETFSEWDLKGQKARIWVAEHQNSKRIAAKIEKWERDGHAPEEKLPFEAYETYYAQPTFVSTAGYFVYVAGREYMEFDFREKNRTTLYIRGVEDIIFTAFESYPEMSRKMADLLGYQPSLPQWVYDGVILASQEGCRSVDRKLELAVRYGIPVCGIWSQDWCGCRRTGFGYQVMWNWSWEDSLYENLPDKIKEWKEKGVRFLGYINPFMAIEGPIYREASEKGYCVKDKEGRDYLVTITTFPAAMIDFTNPDAYQWYKQLIKDNLIGIGMSGWMADFGEYLPVDAVLYSGQNAEEIHNVWPAIWAGLNREAIAECHMEKEIFFFTRAGFTETVKNSPVMWTGDHHVDWSEDDGIGAVIPATLSLAMSGFCISHSDVGGYTTNGPMKRSKELLMRWEELNVFSPIYRFHEGNQPVNNIQFDYDEETLRHLAKMAALHVRLKDYLMDQVKTATEKGIPVMRPVFYHYDEEWAYTDTTQYLLGQDLLVAPVLKAQAKERVVTFPQGEWIHLLTGKRYSEGRSIVPAEIGCPPAFIRAGSKYTNQIMCE